MDLKKQTLLSLQGAIHTSELDRDRSKIDLNECELSQRRTEIDLRSIQLRSILYSVNGP